MLTSTCATHFVLLMTAAIGGQDGAPPGQQAPPAQSPAGGPPPAKTPRGLTKREPGALPGYTMLAPLLGKTVYLVDLDGNVVHQWETGYKPGCEYLLPNGHLLRCCEEPGAPRFNAGGACGRLQEIDWDGSVVWSWTLATDEHRQHHDIEPMPDGTILLIAWEYKSRADAVAAGRHAAHVGKDGIWVDYVLEIQPIHPDGAEVIWEWHAWDHLVQDVDPDAENHGDVAAHPELIDFNWDLRREPLSTDQTAELQALGYITDLPTPGEQNADWLHVNAIDYDPKTDQVLLNSPHLDECWIIDHGTTTDEATGHSGGTRGHGGDLLYRWGNPKNYGAGGVADKKLFGQHDARWIPEGRPGAGHVTIFNNGGGRPDGDHSTIFELVLPLQPDGTYGLEPFVAAGPEAPVWTYAAANPKEFFSSFISGAQRLQNGNTLICEGASGRIFEVTADGRIVWEYLNPFGEPAKDGTSGVPPHALFRATRIPADHPALKGRTLQPMR